MILFSVQLLYIISRRSRSHKIWYFFNSKATANLVFMLLSFMCVCFMWTAYTLLARSQADTSLGTFNYNRYRDYEITIRCTDSKDPVTENIFVNLIQNKPPEITNLPRTFLVLTWLFCPPDTNTLPNVSKHIFSHVKVCKRPTISRDTAKPTYKMIYPSKYESLSFTAV